MPKFDVTAPDGKVYEVNAPDGATQADAISYVQKNLYKQQSAPEGGGILQGLGNAAAGLVRGAGSIGSTLIAPYDIAKDAINGKGLSLESNRQRRAEMDGALESMGADPNSWMYKGGKLVSEVAGTAGAGGALANLFTKVAPAAATAAPAFVEALRTGGMSANGVTGGAGMAARTAGGAIGGGVSAGMVNPEDFGMGLLAGAVAPNVIKAAGDFGVAAGQQASAKYAESVAKFNRGAPMRETLKASIDAGYVVPPNMVNPSTKNAIIESFSGKQATSQLASVRNQDVTERLVRQSLGIADDAPLTKSALEQIRKIEGGAYKQVAGLNPQAEMDLEALKAARNEAQGWFNAYNRSASPLDLAKAKDARDLAEVLELQLESHAKNAGKVDLIPALRDARKRIAKTYTVERALTDSTGTVNAKVLGRMYDKGKPLSDGLDTVGRFASAFPSIAQPSQQFGSAGAHNLRSMASLVAGGGGAAALGPTGLAMAALPYAAGSASRGLMFRRGAQEALANQSAPTISSAQRLAELLQNQELQMLLAKSAPVAISQGQ